MKVYLQADRVATTRLARIPSRACRKNVIENHLLRLLQTTGIGMYYSPVFSKVIFQNIGHLRDELLALR